MIAKLIIIKLCNRSTDAWNVKRSISVKKEVRNIKIKWLIYKSTKFGICNLKNCFVRNGNLEDKKFFNFIPIKWWLILIYLPYI